MPGVCRPNPNIFLGPRCGRTHARPRRLHRLLDGAETTSDSLAGRLPALVAEAGFADVRGRGAVHTAFGTLALISASR